MILTDFQVSQGYYTLPNVDRAINPCDPLGLWDVYSQDLAEQEIENKTKSNTQANMVKKEKLSYADVVRNKTKKDTKVNVGFYSTVKVNENNVKEAEIPTNRTGIVKRKRCVEEAFGEDFIAQQPKKIICLSKKAELDNFCVKDNSLVRPKKISLQQYRQRKALKVVRREPMVFVMTESTMGKRGLEEAFGEDFIVQQPKKIICLSEKAEMERYCTNDETLVKPKKISLQQYRQRKALKVVKRPPMALEIKKKTYADALKCGKMPKGRYADKIICNGKLHSAPTRRPLRVRN